MDVQNSMQLSDPSALVSIVCVDKAERQFRAQEKPKVQNMINYSRLIGALTHQVPNWTCKLQQLVTSGTRARKYPVKFLQLGRQVRVVHEAPEKARNERLEGVAGIGLALLLTDPGKVCLLLRLHRVAHELVLSPPPAHRSVRDEKSPFPHPDRRLQIC